MREVELMGKQGPKPKPTSLKILHGEKDKRRINTEEPATIPGAPVCPDYLDDIAKDKWNETVEKMDAMGTLSQEIGSALELYCVTYSDWRALHSESLRTGRVLVRRINERSSEKKLFEVKRNPFTTEAMKCLDKLTWFEAEFGFTPSSRSRFTVRREPKHKEAKFFGT